MQNSLTLLSLANKFSNDLRDENNKPIYTYNEKHQSHFVRQSTKGGSCENFNQYYKSTISDQVLDFVSVELNVKDNICGIIDKYFQYTNKHRKIIEDEFDSKFDDYRDIKPKHEQEHINKKLNELPVHRKLQKLNLNVLRWILMLHVCIRVLCGTKNLLTLK